MAREYLEHLDPIQASKHWFVHRFRSKSRVEILKQGKSAIAISPGWLAVENIIASDVANWAAKGRLSLQTPPLSGSSDHSDTRGIRADAWAGEGTGTLPELASLDARRR